MPGPVDCNGHPLHIGDFVALYLRSARPTEVVGVLVKGTHTVYAGKAPATTWLVAVGCRGDKVCAERRMGTGLRYLSPVDVPADQTRWVAEATAPMRIDPGGNA